MTITPAPWVGIEGVRINCAAEHADELVTVLDDLAIDWGLDHPLADPRPHQLTVRLLDPFGYWLTRSAKDSLVGVGITVGWTVGAVERIIFRGTISNADISPTGRRRSEDTTEGSWLVVFTATDPTADLANVTFPTGTAWPAESAVLRANRIKAAALAADVDIAEFYFEPDTVNWPMGRTDVGGKSLLDCVAEFYRSFGLGFDYRPAENVVRPLVTYSGNRQTGVARRPGTGDVLPGSGAWTMTGFGNDTSTHWSTAVRGCDVSADAGPLALDRSNGINRIELEYLKADGTKWNTAGFRRAAVVRTLKMTTWLNLDSPNQSNSSRPFGHTWNAIDAALMPQHPPVTWDTRYTDGGFYALEQAYALTRCCGSFANVRITCDPYATALAVAGDVLIIGGRVVYLDGRWIVTMRPAWPATTPALPVTWQTHADAVALATLTWDDPAARWDESVTWADVSKIVTTQPMPISEMR